jgi:hypothetical protein
MCLKGSTTVNLPRSWGRVETEEGCGVGVVRNDSWVGHPAREFSQRKQALKKSQNPLVKHLVYCLTPLLSYLVTNKS